MEVTHESELTRKGLFSQSDMYNYCMSTYVALLRGIMPSNPNMRNEKLKTVFESLGLKDVTPIISSGNVVFRTTTKNIPALETKLEKSFVKELGFSSTTIIRSQEEIEALVKKNPFRGIKDEKPNYLVVTFFKDNTPALCTVINLEEDTGSGFMQKLEKRHGKEITTRTWKTVNRILVKMQALA